MIPHRRFPVEDPSQIGEVRRAAASLASSLGFDDVAAGRVALAVTELGTNLIKHVGPNRQAAILIGSSERRLEVLSLDQGPGMDLHRCLEDGFSTFGSAGTGLGAVRRQADRFFGHSVPHGGTVLAACFESQVAAARRVVPARCDAAISVAGLSLAAPGETVSGDSWSARSDGARHWLVLADGLGHGVEAARAADGACAALHDVAPVSPAELLQRMHLVTQGSRGAAGTVALLDQGAGEIRLAGAGNIGSRVLSGLVDRTLLPQHGTLGIRLHRVQEVQLPWPDQGILILHSDGITNRWTLPTTGGLLQADPLVIAGWMLREHLRGRDDATVVVLK